jgi:hypothetical protein
MKPTFRDMYCALPTLRWNIFNLNKYAILALGLFLFGAYISATLMLEFYEWLGEAWVFFF